jgi:ankyrin repeat protein
MNKTIITAALASFLSLGNLSAMNEDSKNLLKAALFEAVHYQNEKQTEQLLKKFETEQLSIDVKNCSGYTPLHEFFRCAAEDDFKQKVIQKFPCHKKSIVSTQSNPIPRWSIAQLLLLEGASIQTQSNNNKTLFQTARQNSEIEYGIIMYKSDPKNFTSSIDLPKDFFVDLATEAYNSLKNNKKTTFDIFEAIQSQNKPAINRYLKKKGNPNAKNSQGYTPLHYFFAYQSDCNKNWSIAELLLNHNALITNQAYDGTTLCASALQHKMIQDDLTEFQKTLTHCQSKTGLPNYFFFTLDLKLAQNHTLEQTDPFSLSFK